MTAACTWPAHDCPRDLEAEVDVARLQECVDTVVGILRRFTGRQYGCCPRGVVAARTGARARRGRSDGYNGPWYPELDGGVWRNIGWRLRRALSGRRPGKVESPGPVCSIELVVIDGATVDPSLYVLEGDRLYATSGRWPDQDLQAPAGSPGTWTVTYGQGVARRTALLRWSWPRALEFWEGASVTWHLPPARRAWSSGDPLRREHADDRPGQARFATTRLHPEIDMWVASINPQRLGARGRCRRTIRPGRAVSARNLLVPIMGLVEQSLLEPFDPAPTRCWGAARRRHHHGGSWPASRCLRCRGGAEGGGDRRLLDALPVDSAGVAVAGRASPRTRTWPSVAVPKCDQARVSPIEALPAATRSTVTDLLAQYAQIQWDDQVVVDLALCAAMRAVEDAKLAQETG